MNEKEGCFLQLFVTFIENNLRWTLDVIFQEDSLGYKEKKAVHNLGLIRRFVMFIIKLMRVQIATAQVE